MTAPDTRYQLRLSGSDIRLPVVEGGPRDWTRGETAALTAELPDFDRTEVVQQDQTVRGVKSAGRLRVAGGVTLTVASTGVLQVTDLVVDGAVDNNGQIIIDGGRRARQIDTLTEHGGAFATFETATGEVQFRTQLPSGEPVSRLLVGVEPAARLRDRQVVGVWALVEDISDQRAAPLSTTRVEIELRVLARLNEYSTVADVESALLI